MAEENEKQSISVPFLWEEKPGTPNREWPMNRASKDEISSKDGSEYYDDWYSLLSESDGNGSSDNLDDAPFTEFFCPLPLPPNAGFLERVLRESDSKKSSSEEGRPVVKRTLTLEELILLSRKLSYRRKTVDMKKKKRFSMEFVKESLPACFSSKAANRQNNVPITSIYRREVKRELSRTS